MATVALVTENKTITATRVTDARFHCGQALYDFLELAGFVKLANLVRASDVPTADENPR